MESVAVPFALHRIFQASPIERQAESFSAQTRGSHSDHEIIRHREEIDQLHLHYRAELEQARRDGFQAGLVQARTERDAALLAAVDALQAGIEQLDTQVAEALGDMTGEAADLALAAADVIAGCDVQNRPCEAITSAFVTALDQIADGHAIQMRVHPSLSAMMKERLSNVPDLRRRRIELVIADDAALVVGDARIDWKQGGVVLDRAARKAAIISELKSVLDDDAV